MNKYHWSFGIRPNEVWLYISYLLLMVHEDINKRIVLYKVDFADLFGTFKTFVDTNFSQTNCLSLELDEVIHRLNLFSACLTLLFTMA